jgi:hypothetical protein
VVFVLKEDGFPSPFAGVWTSRGKRVACPDLRRPLCSGQPARTWSFYVFHGAPGQPDPGWCRPLGLWFCNGSRCIRALASSIQVTGCETRLIIRPPLRQRNQPPPYPIGVHVVQSHLQLLLTLVPEKDNGAVPGLDGPLRFYSDVGSLPQLRRAFLPEPGETPGTIMALWASS